MHLFDGAWRKNVKCANNGMKLNGIHDSIKVRDTLAMVIHYRQLQTDLLEHIWE
uniref:Uncharacterized protein n=1 Tax=Medicago truncatula TaxID=3880 RepID=Q2HTH6_MEDTR|nr:hypothetical protein MtrDRAFT_AC150441g13v1 [Medicago truncatula]